MSPVSRSLGMDWHVHMKTPPFEPVRAGASKDWMSPRPANPFGSTANKPNVVLAYRRGAGKACYTALLSLAAIAQGVVAQSWRAGGRFAKAASLDHGSALPCCRSAMQAHEPGAAGSDPSAAGVDPAMAVALSVGIA